MAKKIQRGGGKGARPAAPGREEILAFIAENPGKAGKREIARAFGIKGAGKIDLKALLKELASEGAVQRRGKKLSRPGDLASPAIIDITGRDADGGLEGRPVEWDETANGKTPVIFIRRPRGKSAIVAGIGDRILAHVEPDGDRDRRYLARTIKIIDKRREAVLGILRAGEQGLRLEPVQKRQEEIELDRDSIGGAKNGDLVEVQVSKAGRYGLKRGRVVRVIGSIASEKAASMIAIHMLEIPYVFPQAVLEEAGLAEPVSLKTSLSPREDWRHLELVTIDPADAKDHDDAIHAEPDPQADGGFIVTVAIADVAHYVAPGSAMDREALKRGNSVYFPDRVVPMLPERISNDLCSLKEGETRPALAVRMWFGADGRKTRHNFHRILMKSHAKLAYPQAQTAIDGNPDAQTAPLVAKVLQPLWQAYRCLKRGRDAREPLELDLPERKLILKADGTIDRITVPERLDAHRLVEEFMIQANVAAAETLERRRQTLIYRVHDAPSLDKLESLREFLKSLSLSFARSGNLRASQFNRILAAVAGTDREELVNQVVLRSQSQAEYSPKNIGHFGLNLLKYAHFTSPIRRYSDLVVHRALIASLGMGDGGITKSQEELLEAIAADISVTERRAMAAERDTADRLIAAHLSERIGEIFSGRINGVTKAGLFVTLAESGADGFIPISVIAEEYFAHDEASKSLIGTETGTAYQIGQKVDVRLVEARPAAGALRFEMLSEGKPSGLLQRSRPAGRRNGPQRGRRRNGPRRH